VHEKLARTAARAIAASAMAAGGLSFAQVAHAAGPAVTDVPCNAAALAADMSTASSGATLNLASRCVYQLTAGLPIVNIDLVIAGNGATLERSSAPGTPSFTILEVDSGNVTVSSLNFRNGDGAILVTNTGAITVNGGTFTGNTAEHGGAIDDTSVVNGFAVDGATFIGNKAEDGGAIYDYSVGGGSVADSTFYGNQATDGGAIFCDALFWTSIGGIVAHGNSAVLGGGLYCYSGVILDGSQIFDNHATSPGGGLYSTGGPPVASEVSRTVFSGNTAVDGAGIYSTEDTLDVNVTDSKIVGNDASADGGGIYNDTEDGMNFTSSEISGNHAGAYGGGIDNNAGQVAATSTQIVRNTAATGGGGIYDDGAATATLTSSSVLDNKPDNCEPANSIAGCTNVSQGPSGPILSGYRKTVCVDDSNDSRANDTKIVMWACNRTAAQDWAIDADGTIRINGKCMDVYRDEKKNKAPVELWTCTGGANQQWRAVTGTLVNPVSGKCLDDPRFDTADGTQLEIYACNGGANQQWKLP
jgi:predicted outer membrane repeat protein